MQKSLYNKYRKSSQNLHSKQRLSMNSKDIKDEELQFIDPLVDDRVINMILSYDGYSPAMRDGLTFTYINNPFSRD